MADPILTPSGQSATNQQSNTSQWWHSLQQQPGNTSGAPDTPLLDFLEQRWGRRPGFSSDHDAMVEIEKAIQLQQTVPDQNELAEYQANKEQFNTFLKESKDYADFKKAREEGVLGDQIAPVVPVGHASNLQPHEQSEKTRQAIEMGWIVRDDKGFFKGIDNRFAIEAQEANRVLAWEKEAAQRILNDPVGHVMEAGLGKRLEEMQKKHDEEMASLRKQFEDRDARDASASLDAFFESNRNRYWQADGQFTETGNQMSEAVASALELMGKADMDSLNAHERIKMLSYVQGVDQRLSAAEADQNQSSPFFPQSNQPQQVNQSPAAPASTGDHKQQFLDRARANGTQSRIEPFFSPPPSSTVANAAQAEQGNLLKRANGENLDELWDAAKQQALAAIP